MTVFQEFCDLNERRISQLARKFGSYAVEKIEETQIRNFLKQFGETNVTNLELGLKLLEKVDFYSPHRLVNESRELHQTLLAYKNMDIESLLKKPAYFVNFSPSSGHSQDDFTPKYRLGSQLIEPKYDKHFLYLRDVKKFLSKKGVTLIFLTDFIGSGKQVTDIWRDNLWAISPENEHILLSICGYDSGIQKIQQEIGEQLCVITNRIYGTQNRFFDAETADFSIEEKAILRGFCERANQYPTGFRDTQSITVFYFRCPNSVISILRANNPPDWVGLFKRYPD